MKRIVTLMLIAAMFASCEQKSCYIFEQTQVTTVSKYVPGYPQTTVTNIEMCDITSKEASDAAKKLEGTNTSTQSGFTLTIQTTVKVRKK